MFTPPSRWSLFPVSCMDGSLGPHGHFDQPPAVLTRQHLLGDAAPSRFRPLGLPHLVAGRGERSPELSGVVGQTSSRFPAIWPIGLTSYGQCLYIHTAEPVRISWAPATM